MTFGIGPKERRVQNRHHEDTPFALLETLLILFRLEQRSVGGYCIGRVDVSVFFYAFSTPHCTSTIISPGLAILSDIKVEKANRKKRLSGNDGAFSEEGWRLQNLGGCTASVEGNKKDRKIRWQSSMATVYIHYALSKYLFGWEKVFI